MSSKTEIKTRAEMIAFLTELSGNKANITIPRVLVDMTGELAAAAVLNQVMHWSGVNQKKGGWFYKSYKEWQEETGLTQFTISRLINGDNRKARKALNAGEQPKLEQGILAKWGVESDLRRANAAPTMHYRMNWDTFFDAVQAYYADKSDDSIIDKVNNPLSTKSIIHNGQSQQSLTENTTEITTKKKDLPSADGSASLTDDNHKEALQPVTVTMQEIDATLYAVKEEQALKTDDTPKKQRATNPAYELLPSIELVLNIRGNEAMKVANILAGTYTKKDHEADTALFKGQPVTIEELVKFGSWYRAKYAGLSMPRAISKLVNHVTDCRQERAKQAQIRNSAPTPLHTQLAQQKDATLQDAPNVAQPAAQVVPDGYLLIDDKLISKDDYMKQAQAIKEEAMKRIESNRMNRYRK